MSSPGNPQVNLPEVNFKEKVRCGEVYRNLNGNEMFQKFYYRCLECSLDFESSPEFEEHVIAHYLQEDDDCAAVDNLKNNENIINISSDEEENGYLYAFEVASLVEENISENDLPLPLMQMLSEQSADSCDQTIQLSESEEDDERNVAFPCEGLRKQALHQYSEHCCTQCPAYFGTKSELNFHLHIHTLPNTVVCPHCYEAFPNVLKLNEHISLIKKKRKRNNKKCEIDNKTENKNEIENDNFKNCKRAKNQIKEEVQQNKLERDDDENKRYIELNETKDITKELQDSLECSKKTESLISITNASTNCEENNSKDNSNILTDT